MFDAMIFVMGRVSKSLYIHQCFCWPPKSSGHFAIFYDFYNNKITISHTFQYKIVLNIFKISGHLSKISDNGLWPGGNKNTDTCHFPGDKYKLHHHKLMPIVLELVVSW